MKQKKNKTNSAGRSRLNPDYPKPGFKSIEKTSVGGKYNSGVTSENEEEKKQIERKANMNKTQPSPARKTRQ